MYPPGVADALPKATDLYGRTTCDECAADCWISPRQITAISMLRRETYAKLCTLCALDRGYGTTAVQSVDLGGGHTVEGQALTS